MGTSLLEYLITIGQTQLCSIPPSLPACANGKTSPLHGEGVSGLVAFLLNLSPVRRLHALNIHKTYELALSRLFLFFVARIY